MKTNHFFKVIGCTLLLLGGYTVTRAQSPCVDSSLMNPNIVCIALYDPVCGCNGITYGNACEAVNFGGVTSFTPGVCEAGACNNLQVDFSFLNDISVMEVTFVAEASCQDGFIQGFTWDFGDGNSSTQSDATNNYLTGGVYQVCLKVDALLNSGELCSKTGCKTIQVQACPKSCYFTISPVFQGDSLLAVLVTDSIGLAQPALIQWSLDDGPLGPNEASFFSEIPDDDRHLLCATYSTANGGTCTVCTAVEKAPFCVNPDQIDSTVLCPDVFMPVCGCDGKTYSNACEAYNYGGLDSWTFGACGQLNCIDSSLINPMVLCTADYNPVCGCDGVTYSNACIATYYHGVVSYTEGACGDDCYRPNWVNPNVGCFEIYDPVCGCDGITYSNACVASEYYGISSWKKGPCCEMNQCKSFFWVINQEDLTVTLTDASIAAENWYLNWGDGSVYSGTFTGLQHSYTSPGDYWVCLDIGNFSGSCYDQFCRTVTVGATTTREPGYDVSFNLLPNPAQDQVVMQWDPEIGAADVLILDYTGRRFLEQRNVFSGQAFSTQAWPSGFYMVQMNYGKGSVTQRLVVQHP